MEIVTAGEVAVYPVHSHSNRTVRGDMKAIMTTRMTSLRKRTRKRKQRPKKKLRYVFVISPINFIMIADLSLLYFFMFWQPPPDQDGEHAGSLSEWGFADSSLVSGQSTNSEDVGENSMATKRTKIKSSSGTRKSKVDGLFCGVLFISLLLFFYTGQR